ncbi:MAG: hypothetical protein EOQ56_04325 [Mesorhizobium sp.]|nr:MAG: hypothetical protein EOQ56_04325 [Mesorhizobium sp.]
MFERKSAKADTNVPTIADLNPTLATLREKKAKIGEESAKLRAEEFELALSDGPEDADENRDNRLAVILGKPTAPSKPTRLTRRTEIGQRLRDLADAREIIDREIQTETTRASAILQERLRPEYIQRMRGLTDALVALDTAARSCRELSTAVADAGYSNGWMSAHFSRMLEGGRNGPIGTLLNEISRDGYLKLTDIPGELK